jgi:hypothetical protein
MTGVITIVISQPVRSEGIIRPAIHFKLKILDVPDENPHFIHSSSFVL